jgi:hypothetical protein
VKNTITIKQKYKAQKRPLQELEKTAFYSQIKKTVVSLLNYQWRPFVVSEQRRPARASKCRCTFSKTTRHTRVIVKKLK